MAAVVSAARRLDRVEVFLDAIREHFDRHFDRGWLAMIIDELPLESSLVPEIREVLSLRSVYASDLYDIRYGIERLEIFTRDLRRHLLPVLRERLRVSGFTRRHGEDQVGRVHRQFVAAAFPANLERLEDLTQALRDAVRAAA